MSMERMPMVVVFSKMMRSSAGASSPSQMTSSWWPGRPFFMTIGMACASRAPAAMSSSMTRPSASPVQSSRSLSSFVTVLRSPSPASSLPVDAMRTARSTPEQFS